MSSRSAVTSRKYVAVSTMCSSRRSSKLREVGGVDLGEAAFWFEVDLAGGA